MELSSGQELFGLKEAELSSGGRTKAYSKSALLELQRNIRKGSVFFSFTVQFFKLSVSFHIISIHLLICIKSISGQGSL
ncbi:hypothetical protein GJAV_G00065510 [Gymnothorax javanicus]|nr:hypothetical protein GJAV_G00065510 [Gymnothorax javanicus]